MTLLPLKTLHDLVGIKNLAPIDTISENTSEPLGVQIPHMNVLKLALRHVFPRHWSRVDKERNHASSHERHQTCCGSKHQDN